MKSGFVVLSRGAATANLCKAVIWICLLFKILRHVPNHTLDGGLYRAVVPKWPLIGN